MLVDQDGPLDGICLVTRVYFIHRQRLGRLLARIYIDPHDYKILNSQQSQSLSIGELWAAVANTCSASHTLCCTELDIFGELSVLAAYRCFRMCVRHGLMFKRRSLCQILVAFWIATLDYVAARLW